MRGLSWKGFLAGVAWDISRRMATFSRKSKENSYKHRQTRVHLAILAQPENVKGRQGTGGNDRFFHVALLYYTASC